MRLRECRCTANCTSSVLVKVWNIHKTHISQQQLSNGTSINGRTTLQGCNQGLRTLESDSVALHACKYACIFIESAACLCFDYKYERAKMMLGSLVDLATVTLNDSISQGTEKMCTPTAAAACDRIICCVICGY